MGDVVYGNLFIEIEEVHVNILVSLSVAAMSTLSL